MVEEEEEGGALDTHPPQATQATSFTPMGQVPSHTHLTSSCISLYNNVQ
jgi:hypothetical protein